MLPYAGADFMEVGAEYEVSAAAKLLLSFIDQVRRESTRYMSPDLCSTDPLQLAYEMHLSNLSDLDRRDLMRISGENGGHG